MAMNGYELEYPRQIIWYWGHATKCGKLVHRSEIQSEAKILHLTIISCSGNQINHLMTKVQFHSMIIQYNCHIIAVLHNTGLI